MNEETNQPIESVVEEKQIQKKPQTNSIATDGWKPNAVSIDEQYRLAKLYVQSKMLPARFNTPESAMVAMQFASEHFDKPLTAIRQIAVINGVPSFYGDLPLALVRGSGKCEKVEEYYVDFSGKKLSPPEVTLENLFGAVCKATRKDTKETIEICFSKDDAKRAGLYPNGSAASPWSKHPKIMFKMRARGQALRDAFPDVLTGISIAEVDHDTSGLDEKDVSPVIDKAKYINESFAAESILSPDNATQAVGQG